MVKEAVNVSGDETFVDGFISGEINPIFSKTFYTKFGDIFALVCIGLTLLGSLVYRFEKKGKQCLEKK